MNKVGEQDTGSCPNERQVNCKQCDNLQNTRMALQLLLRLKSFQENYRSCFNGSAHLLAEPACRETLLPYRNQLRKKIIEN